MVAVRVSLVRGGRAPSERWGGRGVATLASGSSSKGPRRANDLAIVRRPPAAKGGRAALSSVDESGRFLTLENHAFLHITV